MRGCIRRIVFLPLVSLLAVAMLAACEPTLTLTPEPTATQAPTPTQAPEPTATQAPTPTQAPEPTATQAPTPTQAPEPTATQAPTPTQAPEPTVTQAPTPTPTPTLTPTPMLTPIPTPTLTPPPTPTRDHLPGMVLAQADIESEYPGIPLDPDNSGYQDNEASADDTTDPNDTASDLAAKGRLDGYGLEFFDPQALFGDETPAGRIFGVGTSVDLFDTQESATAFLQREIEDIRRFQGIAIEGVTLNEFQEFIAPDVGTHAVAGRFIVSVFGFEQAGHITAVRWIRGPILATVGVTAFDDTDQSGAVERLTLRMDQRIDDVLAGDISVTLIIPPLPPSSDASEAARREGFDLPAMLISLADLPEGAAVEREGFAEESDAISSYEREFEPKGLVIELGSSQVMNISTKVELHASSFDAKGPVLFLKALSPEEFGELAGPGFVEGAGFVPGALVFESLDPSQIGDAAVGLLMKIETAIGDLDSYFLWFAQGRISAQLIVLGPTDQVALEDIFLLAQLMDERIVHESP